MQPGDTVTPGNQPTPAEPPRPPVPPPKQPAVPKPAAGPVQAEPEAPWKYTAAEDQAISASPESQAAPDAVSWTASEYVAHEKSAGWYVILALAAAAGAGLAYIITEDRVTAAMIVIVAVIFGIFASRKPEVLDYKIDQSGITIGTKHYPYASFRSFAIQEEGAIDSILLIPLQRFMPGISIYFPPEQGQQIVDTLGSYLPHEERPPDAIDRLMRKVRF